MTSKSTTATNNNNSDNDNSSSNSNHNSNHHNNNNNNNNNNNDIPDEPKLVTNQSTNTADSAHNNNNSLRLEEAIKISDSSADCLSKESHLIGQQLSKVKEEPIVADSSSSSTVTAKASGASAAEASASAASGAVAVVGGGGEGELSGSRCGQVSELLHQSGGESSGGQHVIDSEAIERQEDSVESSCGLEQQVSEPNLSELDSSGPDFVSLSHSGQQQQQQSEEALISEQSENTQHHHDNNTTASSNLAGNHDASGVPEYTILTPVTPMRSNQMQAAEQAAQQVSHTSSTILTDLDATSVHHQQQQQQQQHEHQHHQQRYDSKQQVHHLINSTSANQTDSTNQDGSQQQQHYITSVDSASLATSSLSATIKIESTQPSSNAHGPLTELTPIGTTLSELTTVSIHQDQTSADHLTLVGNQRHQQQQQRLNSDQQQLAANPNATDHHLLSSADHQQQHSDLLSGHNQQTLVTIGCLGEQQLLASNRQQSGNEIIAPPSVLNTVGASNASTSSACSSTSNTGASSTGGGAGAANLSSGASTAGSGKRRTWNQVNRNLSKTEIPKVYSQYGFRCYLETPISTCRRKEEDRITYINKGEFYGLSLEYIPDPQKPLRSAIVKTVIMLVFREEKPPEEDLKSWQFWHSRQHSAKQRILDADNKNHVNVINQIEEISLNAIAFYWNPIETRSAKLNVAVQCLSTDFSNQKGVKGLPLNLQVDIYDLFTETSTPVFRGYATLLSYCDKGAQRRSRDEERRALKRKLADTGSVTTLASGGGSASKKFEDLYHKPCDRSEFYSMSDLIRPPTLYTPSEDSLLDGPKQPMSQSSGVSITPISATTPIPSIESLQYNAQAQQQQVPQQAQHPQSVPVSATVINAPQPSRPTPHSSYNIVPASDYMQHPPQALASSTGIGGPAQAVLGVPQQQQSPHGAMVAMGTSVSQQQQQQHQVMSQQPHQHHHYHAIGNTLQPSYTVMQTDHHQPQQYAILQAPPSIPTMVQSHHHHQQSISQQQMVASSTTSQQHPPPMDSRGQHQQQQQQQQQQQPIMMSQTGMIQQPSQQQQQQMQQMHQYQQPLVGITTASIPHSQAPFVKRAKLYPEERVLIYAKQADEKDFYPLHLIPPSIAGLMSAIEQKYRIDSTKVANIYKKSKRGIRVQMDDEMIRHYCNEDTVQLEVIQTSDSHLEITLVEL